MTKIDDGGYAFPSPADEKAGWHSESGMTMRDWFAGHAPDPSPNYVTWKRSLDRERNPYNEGHKPHPRSDVEIIADFKFEYADAMIAARKSEGQ